MCRPLLRGEQSCTPIRRFALLPLACVILFLDGACGEDKQPARQRRPSGPALANATRTSVDASAVQLRAGASDAGTAAIVPPLRLTLAAELSGTTLCGSLDFAPDGTLVTACGADEVREYEPGTWRLRSIFPWGRHGVFPLPVNHGTLAVGSKGLIVVGFWGKSQDQAVFIRNLNRPSHPPSILSHLLDDGPPRAEDLCLGGGDRLLAVTGMPDDRVRIYDPVKLVKLAVIIDSDLRAVACDTRGEFVVTAERAVLVWSVAKRRVVHRLPPHDQAIITKVGIVGSMQRIVAGNVNGWILVWDPRSRERPQVIHRGTWTAPTPCDFRELQARAQGDWLVSLGNCTGLMLSDLVGRNAPIRIGEPDWPTPRSVRFSPDGKWLAATYEKGPLRIWKVETTPRRGRSASQ